MQQQCFPPQIPKQVVLFKHLIIKKVHIKVVWLLVLKDGLSLDPEGVIQVVQIHEVILDILPLVQESGLVIHV